MQGPSAAPPPTQKFAFKDPGKLALSYSENKVNTFVPSIPSFPFSKFPLWTIPNPDPGLNQA